MTRLGWVTEFALTLMRERTKVVRAKAPRPRGAGLANLRWPATSAWRPGLRSPKKNEC